MNGVFQSKRERFVRLRLSVKTQSLVSGISYLINFIYLALTTLLSIGWKDDMLVFLKFLAKLFIEVIRHRIYPQGMNLDHRDTLVK